MRVCWGSSGTRRGLPPHTRARQSRARRSTEPLDLSQTDSAVDPGTDTPITV